MSSGNALADVRQHEACLVYIPGPCVTSLPQVQFSVRSPHLDRNALADNQKLFLSRKKHTHASWNLMKVCYEKHSFTSLLVMAVGVLCSDTISTESV